MILRRRSAGNNDTPTEEAAAINCVAAEEAAIIIPRRGGERSWRHSMAQAGLEIIIGMQFGSDFAQITWCSRGMKEPLTAGSDGAAGQEQYEVSAQVWESACGRGDRSVLSAFFDSCIRDCVPDPVYEQMRIMITLPQLEKAFWESIPGALTDLGCERRRIYLQDYQSGFYYYTVNKRKELWSGDVALLEFKDGAMVGSVLHIDRTKTPALVTVEEAARSKVNEAMRAGRDDEAWDKERDRLFFELLKKVFERRNVVTCYLMGDYYDRSWAPRSFQYLCFRRHAFQLRDRDSGGAPRSLMEALDMLDTWLYGGDPAQGILVEKALEELERALDTDLPERLLRELFLENEHIISVTLVPSVTLGAENAAAEQARVQARTAGWTPADWERQRRQAEALRLWQQSPDSPEALASIPMLRLSDLAETPAPLDYHREALGDVPLLRHRTGSSLAFLRAHFEASDLELEELPALALLCQLLGSMATARLDRARLPLELKRTLGRLSFAPTLVEGRDPGHCRVLFSGALACLPEQSEKAAALLGEILTATLWEDLPLLRDNLQQLTLNAQMALSSGGHRYAITRAAAGLTARGAALEYTGGLEYARWLKARSGWGDDALEGLLAQLADLTRRLVGRERLLLSANENVSQAALEQLLAAIPAQGQPAPGPAAYPLEGARREGIAIPAAVGFAGMASSLSLQNRPYHGSFAVLANVLNYTYLWSEIRVQGGAYGCGFNCRSSGELFYYSYRDPQPARSLEIMAKAPDYLRSFCREEPDLTGFILGSVSGLDPLRGEEARLSAGENRWFRGVTEADVRRWYQQLLGTTVRDLLDLAPALEELAARQALCVTAGTPLLEACGDKLDVRLSL